MFGFIRLFKEVAMQSSRLLFLSIMMVLVIAHVTQAQSQWGDLLKGAQKALGDSGSRGQVSGGGHGRSVAG